jgi:hypothetical protein
LGGGAQAADVAGFNYVYRDFDRYHQLNPAVEAEVAGRDVGLDGIVTVE